MGFIFDAQMSLICTSACFYLTAFAYRFSLLLVWKRWLRGFFSALIIASFFREFRKPFIIYGKKGEREIPSRVFDWLTCQLNSGELILCELQKKLDFRSTTAGLTNPVLTKPFHSFQALKGSCGKIKELNLVRKNKTKNNEIIFILEHCDPFNLTITNVNNNFFVRNRKKQGMNFLWIGKLFNRSFLRYF